MLKVPEAKFVPDTLTLVVPGEPLLGVMEMLWGGSRLKVAVTAFSSSMVNWQNVPEQFPLQKAKTEPAAAEAFRVTDVPSPKASVQSGGQLIPDGVLVTVPEPEPAEVRVRVWVPLCPAQTVLVGSTTTATANRETIMCGRTCRTRGCPKKHDTALNEPANIS